LSVYWQAVGIIPIIIRSIQRPERHQVDIVFENFFWPSTNDKLYFGQVLLFNLIPPSEHPRLSIPQLDLLRAASALGYELESSLASDAHKSVLVRVTLIIRGRHFHALRLKRPHRPTVAGARICLHRQNESLSFPEFKSLVALCVSLCRIVQVSCFDWRNLSVGCWDRADGDGWHVNDFNHRID